MSDYLRGKKFGNFEEFLCFWMSLFDIFEFEICDISNWIFVVFKMDSCDIFNWIFAIFLIFSYL